VLIPTNATQFAVFDANGYFRLSERPHEHARSLFLCIGSLIGLKLSNPTHSESGTAAPVEGAA
jgi:hypothetical protein